jgi:exonuclease SbcC
MIPVRLKLKGFLSYRETAEIDFTPFRLACISGPNGAGKSSLLDAMTWSLFGQARKRDEALINAAANSAEVVFVFSYEGNLYRVQRALGRGKSGVLEFQVGANGDPAQTEWRPLTEKTVRDTQARIRQILRLDYETFVNASFFLQGKADQFTQEPPASRKRILASILGLDEWEIYRNHAAEHRKRLEAEMLSLVGRLTEIDTELAEEPVRAARLEELERQLAVLAAARKLQAEAVDAMRRVASSIAEQRRLVDSLAARAEKARGQVETTRSRLAARETEWGALAELRARAPEVEEAYAVWLRARAALERLDELAMTFREYEKQRQPFLDDINREQARLEQERASLEREEVAVQDQRSLLATLDGELGDASQKLAEAEAEVARREREQARLNALREELAAVRAENESLRSQMDEIKDRIGRIEGIETPTCPLCGQPLSPEHRESTIAQLEGEGKRMGDRWRSNRSRADSLEGDVSSLEGGLALLERADDARIAQAGLLAELNARRSAAEAVITGWSKVGSKRLAQIEKLLTRETYSPDARKSLRSLDRELKRLGYDVAAHERVREEELQDRQAQTDMQALEAGGAALAPLEREIRELKAQLSTQHQEASELEAEYEAAIARLAGAESSAPDLRAAELALLDAQERENIVRQELGAARQKVTVLGDLRQRQQELTSEREALAQRIGEFRMLERAFGKDGVPALLVEQALPEIESHANEVLDRLSNGAMSVRFVTQAQYRDKKRDDLRETLDLVISDSSGSRDYELFSGGEAFRVNFAVRLALSRVLAQRTGARLQMLIIDEGFGSQDAAGRQRLIEAINLASKDFAKILIITHMDELKDAFPNRIEVDKTPMGSVAKVY